MEWKKTKLTKSDRDAFVSAVLNDIPRTDYDKMARDLVLKASKDALPDVLKNNWIEVQPYIAQTYYWMPDGLGTCAGYAQHSASARYATTAFPEVSDRVKDIAAKARQQRAEREATKRELMTAIASCTTLKQAKQRFPDLVKYLPADREPAKTTNVPAIRTEAVMAALTRAGWKKAA